MSKPTLAWSDLFSEGPGLDLGRLLALWPATVCGRIRPIGMSAFGDVYFERPDGGIERLDVLEGGVHRVAPSHAAFTGLMNTQAWQEENLLSEGVALLHDRGLRRAANQCFAFAPHPALSGRIAFDRVLVMDAGAWHVVCSQLLDAKPGSPSGI